MRNAREFFWFLVYKYLACSILLAVYIHVSTEYTSTCLKIDVKREIVVFCGVFVYLGLEKVKFC